MWVATSDNVPGLVAEAESLDALPKIPASPIPELLQANGRIEHVAGVFEEIGRAAQQSIAELDRNRYTQPGDALRQALTVANVICRVRTSLRRFLF